MDSDSSEKHVAGHWNQITWNDNKREVRLRAEALVATELNRPLPTQVSLESIGLVEVSYPALTKSCHLQRFSAICPTTRPASKFKRLGPVT